jgi:PadR family transcriptional regulator, regulatory protein PadR
MFEEKASARVFPREFMQRQIDNFLCLLYRNPISDSDMIDRDFVRGLIKLYALSLAADGDVYGLKILEEMNKHGFSLSPGTLYPALHALLREGDVTVRQRLVGGKIRKCYRLTPKGRRELDEVKQRLRTLVRIVFR